MKHDTSEINKEIADGANDQSDVGINQSTTNEVFQRSDDIKNADSVDEQSNLKINQSIKEQQKRDIKCNQLPSENQSIKEQQGGKRMFVIRKSLTKKPKWIPYKI